MYPDRVLSGGLCNSGLARQRSFPMNKHAPVTEVFTPVNAAVWFEIPVTDMARAKAFYGAVLKTELKDDNAGPNPMSLFPAMNDLSVAGHLYPGKPSKGSGSTIHLA